MVEYCIYGAGRHGKVLMDFIESTKSMKLNFFIDDKNENRSAEYEGYKIIDFSTFKARYMTTCNNVLIAISNNIIRENKYNLGKEIGCNFPNFIHPTVILSPRVIMEDAVQILPGTILNTSVVIGRNTIIHTDGTEELLPSKGSFPVDIGDILRIETPGGGGWNEPS